MSPVPVVVAVALVLASALLAAVETVVVRLPLVRGLRLDEEQARGAPALLWLLEHRSSALNVLLVLTVSARVTATALVTLVVLDALPAAAAVAVAVAVVTLTVVVVGEIAPRSLALRHLEAAGLSLAPPARLVVRAVGPLARLLSSVGRWLVHSRSDVSGPFADDEELAELLDGDDHDDAIEPDERAMIHSIFELGDTIVREIMVPRPDMVTIAADAPRSTLVATITEHGYSRIPVLDPDDRDRVVGTVYAKDVLRHLATHPERDDDWSGLVREPTFVPEIKRVDALLRWLQEQAVHLAIVVDEYGAVAGLVTIEDILEEIVGEIVDEHDREEPLVETLAGDRLRVDARLPVDDLNDLFDASLPTEGWDTVGGLVFGTLGRVPQPGDTLELEGLRLVVERVQGRRIGKVLVARRSEQREQVPS